MQAGSLQNDGALDLSMDSLDADLEAALFSDNSEESTSGKDMDDSLSQNDLANSENNSTPARMEDERSITSDSLGYVLQKRPEETIPDTEDDVLPKELFKDEEVEADQQQFPGLAIIGGEDDVSTLANETVLGSMGMAESPRRETKNFDQYTTPVKENKSRRDDDTLPETPPARGYRVMKDYGSDNSILPLASKKLYMIAGLLGFVLLASIGALSFALVNIRAKESSSSSSESLDDYTFPPGFFTSPTSQPTAAAVINAPESTLAPTPSPVTSPPTMEPTVQNIFNDGAVFDFSAHLAIRSPKSLEILEDPDSPHFRSFEFVTSDPKYFDYGPDRAMQRWVLGVFFLGLSEEANSTSPANLTLWMTDADECSWYSTRTDSICNEDGLYRNLDLWGLDLYGTIPAELSLLSGSLEQIMLPDNNLGGTIPSELGELSLLGRLRLSSNLLVGAVPSELGRLTNLEVLSLDRNELQGTIPTDLGNLPKLDTLGLERNRFKGEISSEICELKRNKALDLLTVDCNEVSCGCCSNCPTPQPTQSPVSSPRPTPCTNQIQVTKNCFRTGGSSEPITTTFTNCDARNDDWIGLYLPSANPVDLGDAFLWSWTCGNQNCRGEVKFGSLTLNQDTEWDGNEWPLDEGDYKLFLIRRNAGGPYSSYAESSKFQLKNSC